MNLTVCKNTKVDIIIPLNISENLDKLNTSSGYFNDVCYKSTSDSGTDITLKNRRDEFIEENKTVCQDGCDFTYYNNSIKKVTYSCEVKETSDNYADMKIDSKKLLKNFIDIKNIANINILKCYKSLFCIKGIKHNIGSFITISIFIFHNISIFIYYKFQLDKLKNKINEIILCIKNLDLSKNSKKKNKEKENFKINKNIQKFNNKKKANRYKPNKKGKGSSPPNKKKSKKKIMINNNINLNNNMIIYNSNINIISNNKMDIHKIKELMKYNEGEINDLKYEKALIYDNRNFCGYYLSLIKTKHDLIFSFCYNEDYNSKIIKIDLFFINFVMNFAVNALFFTDDSMHKIYEEQGKFQFLYQLPQIIYSSIISMGLNYLLQLLALSEEGILEFKRNKNVNNISERKIKLFYKLLLKSILFFISSIIFLLIFWYYIAMFCAIYENTQMHLLNDTLISFGLSLLYPFWIYLLPGMFRIPSLLEGKKNNKSNGAGKCLYNFSKFLQIF